MNQSNTPDNAQELAMIYALMELGGIAESNCHYTAGLARRIEQTGKTFEQLTVAELLTLHREYNEQFNKMYGGEA